MSFNIFHFNSLKIAEFSNNMHFTRRFDKTKKSSKGSGRPTKPLTSYSGSSRRVRPHRSAGKPRAISAEAGLLDKEQTQKT